MTDDLLENLNNLSEEELRELLRAQDALEQRLKEEGPQNDDELHEWIKHELGVDIPRVSVCRDHVAPFDFLSDLYFERTEAALGVASRGGAKTFIVAILHWINSLFKPGCESCTFGAIEAQGDRAYSHLKRWIYDDRGNKKSIVESTLRKETIFSNGSRIEVLGSTPECHPPDELILTLDGYKPIAELDPESDRLASYKKTYNQMTWGSLLGRRGKHRIAFPFTLQARHYSGPLIIFEGGAKTTRVTPNHIVRIRFKPEFRERWVVYLMRKGDWWRIGKTRGRSFNRCMNEERGDEIWILEAFSSEVEALEAEQIYQAKYGITGVSFYSSRSNSRINDVARIHDALAPEAASRAATLLSDLDMTLVPFMRRTNGLAGRMTTNDWFDVTAGNACRIGSLFVMPSAPEDFESGGFSECVPDLLDVKVRVEQYEGDVYSMNVEPYHYYVANGILVHNSVNGPHPQKSHADEIELMRDDTYKESRNMTVSKRLKNGKVIKPQDILTSTRKGPSGRVQQLIDEIDEAIANGYQPPRRLYMWCLKEAAAQVKNCRVARPDLPEAFKCPCNRIKKGEWEDGSPRTLDRVCNGDFYKSRGWQPFGDIVKHFRENDRHTFEVQQLCMKPEMSFHYVSNWRDEKHLIRNYKPDPANGPIFTSTDWGGSNPHAVNWYQLLRNEVEAEAWLQPDQGPRRKVRLKEGTIVCFDEIYISEIGNEKLGQLVKAKEQYWRSIFGPAWQVYERYADPQGKAARDDWKAMGLRTTWRTTREFEEHIKAVKSLFEDDLFRCAGDKCEKFVWEIKQWRMDERTGKQIDAQNHCMSNFRYLVANLKKIRRRIAIQSSGPTSIPIQRRAVRISRTNMSETPVAFRGRGDNEFDNWRKSLGAPISVERRHI